MSNYDADKILNRYIPMVAGYEVKLNKIADKVDKCIDLLTTDGKNTKNEVLVMLKKLRKETLTGYGESNNEAKSA